MSEEAASADSLLRENAALRAEIAHRAKIDAEDMHRIQERYEHLRRQFEALQTWVARGMALQPAPPIVLGGVSAQLLAELAAARAVVAMARSGFGTEEDIRRAYAFDPNALTAAIRDYDAVTKASTE